MLRLKFYQEKFCLFEEILKKLLMSAIVALIEKKLQVKMITFEEL